MKKLLLLFFFLFSAFAGTINFQQGWNFVGFNNNMNFSTDAVFSDISKVKLIWKYVNDPKLPTVGWQVYSADANIQNFVNSKGLYSFNTLLSYEGAWVYANKSFSYSVSDSTDLNSDIPVYRGWNLLSAVNNSSIAMDENIFTQTKQIWVYRNSQWFLKINGADTPSIYGTLSTINPYEAFWIYSENDIVSSSSSSSNATTSSSSTSSTQNQSSSSEEEDEDESSSSSVTTTSSSSSGISVILPSNNKYTLLAWNDLGMHCMDGKDFSVFSILPPFNNLNAQLIIKDGTTNKHVVSGVTITYTASASLDNKLNTTSMFDNTNKPKTNFWDFVGKLFNTTLLDDIGLTNNPTPSLLPKPLSYNTAHNWWEATGIPLTPYNDDGTKNYYPMVDVTAKDSSGTILASTKVVLPVSDEMDCKACHSSTSNYTSAKPLAGWENDSDVEKDFKFNILRLHDQKYPNAVLNYQTELKAMGYNNYADGGLYTSAKNGNPILCATCHASNALSTTGVTGVKPLTESLHALHSNVLDPVENIKLGDSTNRSSCYRCHPGATTKCLRGAMGKQSNIECQSCHGDMNAVGKHGRVGWLDEPNCQSCHQEGQRYTTAVTNTVTGTLRASLDNRFATNVNTPATGISMYRFSTGHGDMQCSACHGSTHAIYPSSHTEDNLQSIAVQGHEGTIAECTACHTTTPTTLTGGPHGMHTIGQAWISSHEHASKTGCTACHGSDSRGTVLSKTFSARNFSVEHKTKTYTAGQMVTCYDCHNGPKGD